MVKVLHPSKYSKAKVVKIEEAGDELKRSSISSSRFVFLSVIDVKNTLEQLSENQS